MATLKLFHAVLVLVSVLFGSLLSILYVKSSGVRYSEDCTARQIYTTPPLYDDTSVADDLFRKVKVFCWVLTYPENHRSRAIHTSRTWTKRCNDIIFMSDAFDPAINAIPLNTTPGRGHLASKSREALDYLYRHHVDDADWFLKADDDTYVIMENLRYLLLDHDPETAIFFGKRFVHPRNESYFAGGAGYVLSRKALSLFGGRPTGLCLIDLHDGSNEDVRVSECLQSLGVQLGDAVDHFGRYRFHHFTPEMHMLGTFPRWYERRSSLIPTWGIGRMSATAISFHKVEPQAMYMLEYFIYHLRPYGILFGVYYKNTTFHKEKKSLEKLRNAMEKTNYFQSNLIFWKD